MWSLITAFQSRATVKLIFENFGIPSLKVEILSFQMIIILRKLTTYRKLKKDFIEKQKLVDLIHEHLLMKLFEHIFFGLIPHLISQFSRA